MWITDISADRPIGWKSKAQSSKLKIQKTGFEFRYLDFSSRSAPLQSKQGRAAITHQGQGKTNNRQEAKIHSYVHE